MMHSSKMEGGALRPRAPGAAAADRQALHALLAIASSAQQELKRPPQKEQLAPAVAPGEATVAHGKRPLPQDALQRMAESVRAVTEASGVAIAVARGAEIVCVASIGTCAIEVGASIDLDRGLAAKCVRTGEAQSCSDSEHDPGVNREACRELGVRSMVMFPLRRRRQPVAGVLSVFSDRPAHFTLHNLRFLEFMAGLVLEAAERGQEPSAAPAVPATEPPGAPVAEPIPDSQEESSEELPLLEASAPRPRRWIAGVVLPLAALAVGALLWPEIQSRLRPPANPQAPAAEVRAPEPAAPQASAQSQPASASAVTPLEVPAVPSAAPDGRALLTAMRYASAPGMTRVVLDLDRAVRYQSGRLDHPPRVFLDLADTHLALAGRSFPADDLLLSSIRVAQNQQEVARVVLDLKVPADYSVTQESSPPRLVIELHAATPK
jgi:putative methionine-R-sulfoxide reductase with GAF domain